MTPLCDLAARPSQVSLQSEALVSLGDASVGIRHTRPSAFQDASPRGDTQVMGGGRGGGMPPHLPGVLEMPPLCQGRTGHSPSAWSISPGPKRTPDKEEGEDAWAVLTQRYIDTLSSTGGGGREGSGWYTPAGCSSRRDEMEWIRMGWIGMEPAGTGIRGAKTGTSRIPDAGSIPHP